MFPDNQNAVIITLVPRVIAFKFCSRCLSKADTRNNHMQRTIPIVYKVVLRIQAIMLFKCISIFIKPKGKNISLDELLSFLLDKESTTNKKLCAEML